MDQHSISELFRTYRKRYRRAGKKEKTRIVENLLEATGYHRKHVLRCLNERRHVPKKVTRTRTSRYEGIRDLLTKIWAFSNFLCGKRLQPFLPTLIQALKRHKEIKINKPQQKLLTQISAATIDRLLKKAKRDHWPRGHSTTKSGPLLKHQIPIRTFADWDDNRPGFLEVDLVAHCGDANAGEYVNTLNLTEIATGWTVCVAFMGRSERFCIQALEEVKPHLPFPILGLDCDNDAVFLNAHLLRYCKRHSITFTRGRPYKKNDQCHVEQKNSDVIRKMIGYARFDTEHQLDLLKRTYQLLMFYQNFFQPSQKLIAKQRVGTKVKKVYDQAKTPCQRLRDHPEFSQQNKAMLLETFKYLNPARLLRDIESLITQLYTR